MILVFVRDGLYHYGNCFTVNLFIEILFWNVLYDSNMPFPKWNFDIVHDIVSIFICRGSAVTENVLFHSVIV